MGHSSPKSPASSLLSSQMFTERCHTVDTMVLSQLFDKLLLCLKGEPLPPCWFQPISRTRCRLLDGLQRRFGVQKRCTSSSVLTSANQCSLPLIGCWSGFAVGESVADSTDWPAVTSTVLCMETALILIVYAQYIYVLPSHYQHLLKAKQAAHLSLGIA